MDGWRKRFWMMLPLAVAGCVVNQPVPPPRPTSQPVVTEPRPAAEALAMRSEFARHAPQIDLNRDRRGPVAFMGYEGPNTSYMYLRTDDRQSDEAYKDRYDRRAIIVQESSVRR
jgi:hypothetical protein